MKWIALWILTAPVWATDAIHYMEIPLEISDSGVNVAVEPVPLMPYELLRDDRYSVDGMFDIVLDGSLRQTAFMLRTMERNRGVIYSGENEEPFYLLEFKYDLALRRITGDPVQLRQYKVLVGLAAEEDTGIIVADQGGGKYEFKISELTQPEAYQAFLKNIVFPFDKMSFPLPQTEDFLVDLYYHWPRFQPPRDSNLIDLFPSLIMWDRNEIKKLQIHLGTTYSHRENGTWQQAQSLFYKRYKDSITSYTELLKTYEEGDSRDVIPLLEDYLQIAPGDKKALKLLMDNYLEAGMNIEAFSLIDRFRPIFATIRGGMDNERELAEEAAAKRTLLLGRKARFKRNQDVQLKITSPVDRDLVSGTTDLTFELSGNEADILEIETYLDNELIAKVYEPPFRAKFTVDGNFGRHQLSVVAYFVDETYQRDDIRIDTIQVGAEAGVQLVTLQATVFRGERAGDRELTKKDFEVRENRKKKELQHFSKSTAPLRIAILLDTSLSMVGEKLHKTQFAVKTFLSKLEQEDEVSVFTFDSKVLEISDFTNDFNRIAPQLMTLSPLGSTSLYDAMIVGHDAVMGRNGTKVIIVLSDGEDSDSAANDIHVARLVRESPVMVYSIVLPGDFLGQSNQRGNRFLEEMARLSGSIHTQLRRVNGLSEAFDRIYEDLKNLYYFGFYSNEPNPDKRKIRVKVDQPGSKIRYRAIN